MEPDELRSCSSGAGEGSLSISVTASPSRLSLAFTNDRIRQRSLDPGAGLSRLYLPALSAERQPCISQGRPQCAVQRSIHGSKQEKDGHERGIERHLYEIHRTQREHELGIEIPAVRSEIGDERYHIGNCREAAEQFEGR